MTDDELIITDCDYTGPCQCPDCEYDGSDTTAFKCDECGNHVCVECIYECDGCNNHICCECECYCDRCEESYCGDCADDTCPASDDGEPHLI